MRSLFLLPLLVLAACPEAPPPDDSCFDEGSETVTLKVTVDADTDVGDAVFDIRVEDCMEGTAEASAGDGETVEITPPSTGDLVIHVSGDWGDHDSGGVGGSCQGEAEINPVDGVNEVTVSLMCETLD
ncbi:MAG: hypothetical protein ACK4YP_07550 [Myxococcota bacterium]